ncbi:biopolymer transporter ExbD [Bremerella cremea]|uniref:Biopolymer transporter ExbD n=1 Tax=Bremerella cremea TaxID=1031537 RepID=A0A368KKV6_9BACT|nr:biopolymer transporter ExbD [Bremerella cremea]RCS41397.1 biopolymer transporter ExbD [Bremerella cremea]
MKLRKNEVHGREKVEVPMTPMIDIVFQLLVFFIMTFKIVAMEGDFNINMPQAAQGSPSTTQIALTLSLRAGPSGNLQSVSLNNLPPFEGSVQEKFRKLQDAIVEQVGVNDGPSTTQEESEIEIDADYQLHYNYVIQAITAVTGRIDPKTGEVQKLIEKIKFAPGSGSGS